MHGTYAASAAVQVKEGRQVFERLQRKLAKEAQGNG
jgi:hypothetical protein